MKQITNTSRSTVGAVRPAIRLAFSSFLTFVLAFTLLPLPHQGTPLPITQEGKEDVAGQRGRSFLSQYIPVVPSSAYAADDAPLTALELEQAIEEAQQAYAEARDVAEEAAEKVAEQEERINQIETELLPAQQERAGRAMREMYKTQQNGFDILDLLLNAGSLRDFINQFEYVTRVTADQQNEVVRLNQMKQELEDSRTELRAAQEEADKLVDETAAALEVAKEAQAEAQRRIEEEAQREAALAASGGLLAGTNRENDTTTSDQSTPTTPSNPDNSGSAGSGSSGNSGPAPSSDSLEGWAARIDAYLAGTPMAGQGYTFASAALTYGVDPRFSPAIACCESGKGRYCFLPYNAWGWGSVSWSSWEEAINAHVRGLANGYGYTVTVAGAQKYCPPNWQFWYNTVSTQMSLI